MSNAPEMPQDSTGGPPDRPPGPAAPPFPFPLHAVDFCAMALAVVAVELAGRHEIHRLQIASQSVEELIATMVIRAAQVVAMLVPLRLIRGFGPAALGLRWGDWRKGLMWAVAVSAALAGGFAAASLAWHLATGGNLVQEVLGRSPLDAAKTTGARAAILVSMGLVGPVAEELFFRGGLYAVLRQSLSVPQAVVVTSLFFASAHAGQVGLPVIQLVGGVAFAVLYEKTGSLLAPVLVHAAGNLAILLFSRFAG